MNEPLPIDQVLPDVQRALQQANALLLMAPPGSGKTTRVPPALLQSLGGQEVIVLEPRRLAARAAAARVAQELGCALGTLVGYQVRGDACVSKATRLRFVTEGVLVRALVRDPFLSGVAAVCLDEFHERHLEGDLALAMLAEVQATVREDLRLCVMSATLDAAPLRAFLPQASTVHSDGRLHPVEIVHLGSRADAELDLAVRAGVERALDETSGDVLVFLPGVAEIERAQDALANLSQRRNVLVVPLHGRLEPAAQDRAISPQRVRKVVLSTNVAESSLTIAGVTAVVDSGLAQQMSFDRGRGVDVLRKERISLASCTQRAGRAGRTGPGKCYRLWSLAEERGMAAVTRPEVQRVDLCAPSLLVRAFSGRDPAAFGWYEAPVPEALQSADDLLFRLGALQPGSRQLTKRGELMLGLPLHPRLAAVVLAGRELGAPHAAATAATLLSDVERLGAADGADLLAAVDAFLRAEEQGFSETRCREFGSWPGQARQLRSARDRLLLRGSSEPAPDNLARCLLAGFPDRVVARSPGDARTGTMVGGRGVTLPAALDGHEFALALRLLETGRQQRSKVVLAAALEYCELADGGCLQTVVVPELDAANGRVLARREVRYLDLPLATARGGELPHGAARALLQPLLAADPWRWLGEQREFRRLLARVQWLRARLPDADLPGADDAAVAEAAVQLLGDGADLRGLRDAEVSSLFTAAWSQAQRRALQQFAPDRVALPSGREAIIDYAAAAGPTIAARLQEFFGLPAVAALAQGRVPVVLELLAPNHRPVQVTTDLASFWKNIYPEVRRELSRRYPRHSWPEDPLAARPEARPQRRRLS